MRTKNQELTLKAVEYAQQWSNKNRQSWKAFTLMVEVNFWGSLTKWDIYPTKYAKTKDGRNFLFQWDEKAIALLTDDECEDLVKVIHKHICG